MAASISQSDWHKREDTMTKRFLIGVAALLVTAWGMTTAADAGESGTLKGEGRGVSTSSTFVNGQGQTIIQFSNKQVFHYESPDGPVMVAGEAVGMGLVEADGTYAGGKGYFTARISEEDSYDAEFIDHALGGIFVITGGSGRWKGAKSTNGIYTYLFNDGERFAYTYSFDYTIP